MKRLRKAIRDRRSFLKTADVEAWITDAMEKKAISRDAAIEFLTKEIEGMVLL